MRKPTIALALALTLLTSFLLPLRASADPETTNCLYPSPTDRFGVTVYSNQQIDNYDVTPLSAGRYLDWKAKLSPSHPNGMSYYHMVRLSETSYIPSGDTLRTIVRANPGAVWIIGNEADDIYQDNVTPEAYVRNFHDVYTLITSIDPTARFVMNGIVQVSPLRLAWLERIWTGYRTTYGTDIPVDLWNIHTYVANEMHQKWGFDVPPGFPNAVGYTLYDGTQWTQVNVQGASGGTVHQSRTTGASAYFAFRGNEVTIYLRSGPDAGIAQIFMDLDSRPKTEIDLYAATPGTVSRTFSNLTPPGGVLEDRHNIQVVVTGRKNSASSNTWIRVDAMRAPSTIGLPNGRFEDNDPLRARIISSIEDHDSLTMIAQQIRDFRQWMFNHGQRNKPLINTEYGILLTEDLGFTYQRVRTFMLNSFNLFVNDLVDPNLGYPDDGNHMLQEWFWFSLAVNRFEGRATNTGLYDETTRLIKPLGHDFGNYTTPLKVSYTDLEAVAVGLTPHWALFAGSPSLIEINATVRNRGNVAAGPFQVAAKSGGTAFNTWNLPGLPKQYDAGYMTTLHYDWSTVITGDRNVRVVVDEPDQVVEPCANNNSRVVALAAPQTTDFAVTNLRSVPALVPPIPPGTTTTVNLKVDLANLGSIGTSASQIIVKFWRGNPASGGVLLGTSTVTPGVTPPVSIDFAWANVSPGLYNIYVQLDPVAGDTNAANDVTHSQIMVPVSRNYIPLVPNRASISGLEAREAVSETITATLPFILEPEVEAAQ